MGVPRIAMAECWKYCPKKYGHASPKISLLEFSDLIHDVLSRCIELRQPPSAPSQTCDSVEAHTQHSGYRLRRAVHQHRNRLKFGRSDAANRYTKAPLQNRSWRDHSCIRLIQIGRSLMAAPAHTRRRLARCFASGSGSRVAGMIVAAATPWIAAQTWKLLTLNTALRSPLFCT